MSQSRTKYPRTPHLPWSLGQSDDDAVLQNVDHFLGKEVVITEKLDGENTTMYSDYIHARSINSRPHPSRDWVKKLHSNISYQIPLEWRLCGENLFAQHSIKYDNLESYFYLFSIWDDRNICLDWLQTLEWAKMLNLHTPRELYRGLWNEKIIYKLPIDTNTCEGFVVRTLEAFAYDSFHLHVAKWVRKQHITTGTQWMNQKIIPNSLKSTG